jgi:hypothetical protein
MNGFDKPIMRFKFTRGRPMIEFIVGGSVDIHYKTFNENILMMKMTPIVRNLIFGPIKIDFSGTIVSYNHTTGEKATITFFESKGNNPSYIEGKGFYRFGI